MGFIEGFAAGSSFVLELRKQKQEAQLAEQRMQLERIKAEREEIQKNIDNKFQFLNYGIGLLNATGPSNATKERTLMQMGGVMEELTGDKMPPVVWDEEYKKMAGEMKDVADMQMFDEASNKMVPLKDLPGGKARIRELQKEIWLKYIPRSTEAIKEFIGERPSFEERIYDEMTPEQREVFKERKAAGDNIVKIQREVTGPQGTFLENWVAALKIDPQGNIQVTSTAKLPIPGGVPTPLIDLGTKGLSAEGAGRLSNALLGKHAIATLANILFPDDEFSKSNLLIGTFPGGKTTDAIVKMISKSAFTKRNLIRSNIQSMLDPIVRVRTGATLTKEEQEEVTNQLSLFILDNAETTADKLFRASFLINSFIDALQRGPQLEQNIISQMQSGIPSNFKSLSAKDKLDYLLGDVQLAPQMNPQAPGAAKPSVPQLRNLLKQHLEE